MRVVVILVALCLVGTHAYAAAQDASVQGDAPGDSIALDDSSSAPRDPAASVPPDPTASAPRDPAAEEEELRQIREQIERMQEKASDLRGREQGLLAGLDEFEREIALRDRLLRGLDRRRERVLGVLQEARQELEWASAELSRRQLVFMNRLRAMYKLGKYHEYEIILGSTSFVDLVRRYDYILSVAARDHALREAVARQVEEVERRETALRATAAEIARIEADTEIERGRILAKKEERMRMLQEIRSERRNYEGALEELEASAARLQLLITSFEEKREFEEARHEAEPKSARDDSAAAPPPAPGIRGRQGRLAWPTGGKVVETFGRQVHPEFGTTTFNNGIDIRAEAGLPIRCVAAGTVEFASTLPGYGNCVIVNHGDGFYTVYAHASEVLVKEGAAVAEDQEIARVGSTGSLSGDRLHFEIRDGKKPVDPLTWLKRRSSK